MTTNAASPLVAEAVFVLLAVAVFYASSKRYGAYRTGVFLGGAILWTAFLENFAVLNGGYTYYSYEGQLFPGFPGYLFWVGTVPLWILLGWFVFSMSGYVIFHDILLRGRSTLVQATAAGLFAVDIDLMMDPAAYGNGLWVWLAGSFPFLGIPLFNFIGWFLLIFLYFAIAKNTIFTNGRLPGLGWLEERLFGEPHPDAPAPDLRRFILRTVVIELLVIAFLYSLSNFLDYLARSVL